MTVKISLVENLLKKTEKHFNLVTARWTRFLFVASRRSRETTAIYIYDTTIECVYKELVLPMQQSLIYMLPTQDTLFFGDSEGGLYYLQNYMDSSSRATLLGKHKALISNILIVNDLLWSGSLDWSVKLWNWKVN
jgi:hypothetical protein